MQKQYKWWKVQLIFSIQMALKKTKQVQVDHHHICILSSSKSTREAPGASYLLRKMPGTAFGTLAMCH